MTQIPVELPLVLIPVITVELFGLRRFGSINGLTTTACQPLESEQTRLVGQQAAA